MPTLALADEVHSSTTTVTTMTASDIHPEVETTTTVVTILDPNLLSTTTTVKGSDGMLYTTTMSPALVPDAFYLGPSGPWDREGYGSMYELNSGISDVRLNSSPRYIVDQNRHIDLDNNRVLVMLTKDAGYAPATMMSDEFERGLANPEVTQFDPAALEISTGTTVTLWSDVGHHIIAVYDGPVHMENEAPIDTSETWSHTFNTPGRYRIMDTCGGGPTGSMNQGLFIHVTGPRLYTYYETINTVASIDTTVVTTEQKTTTITQETPPEVKVEATHPTPEVVQPRPRDKDLK
jgi:plastocyanin